MENHLMAAASFLQERERERKGKKKYIFVKETG